MVIYVIDPVTFETKYIIDQYESLVWTDAFAEYGSFQLEFLCTKDLVDNVTVGSYLRMYESTKWMIVETVEINCGEEADELTIKGRSIESILERRVIAKKYGSKTDTFNLIWEGGNATVHDGHYIDMLTGAKIEKTGTCWIELASHEMQDNIYLWNLKTGQSGTFLEYNESNVPLSQNDKKYTPTGIQNAKGYSIYFCGIYLNPGEKIVFRSPRGSYDIPRYVFFSTSKSIREDGTAPVAPVVWDEHLSETSQYGVAHVTAHVSAYGYVFFNEPFRLISKLNADGTSYISLGDTTVTKITGSSDTDVDDFLGNFNRVAAMNSSYNQLFTSWELGAPQADELGRDYYTISVRSRTHYYAINYLGSAGEALSNGFSVTLNGKGQTLVECINTLIDDNCIHPDNDGSSSMIIPDTSSITDFYHNVYSNKQVLVSPYSDNLKGDVIEDMEGTEPKHCYACFPVTRNGEYFLYFSKTVASYKAIMITTTSPSSSRTHYNISTDLSAEYHEQNKKTDYYVYKVAIPNLSGSNQLYAIINFEVSKTDLVADATFKVVPKIFQERVIPNFETRPWSYYQSHDPRIAAIQVKQCFFGESLYDAIYELTKERKIGINIVVDQNSGHLIFELRMGTNRTPDYRLNPNNPPVILSRTYGDIVNGSYIHDISAYKNTVVYVGMDVNVGPINLSSKGSFSYGNGYSVDIGKPKPSGLQRYEIGVDAGKIAGLSQLASNNGMQFAESFYRQKFNEKAKETFKAHKEEQKFTGDVGEVKSYVYGVDYFLGDTIRVEYEYGENTNDDVVVSEWTITDDGEGFRELPLFEKIVDDDM